MGIFDSLVKLKAPSFHYLDKNIHGTFVRMSEEGAENDYVYIYYKPTNSMTTIKLPIPIHKKHIHFINATETDILGVEKQSCYVRTGEQGSLVDDFLGRKLMEENENLRGIIKSLKLQNATMKQVTEESSSGAESFMAKVNNLNKQNTRRSPFSPESRYGLFDNEYDV